MVFKKDKKWLEDEVLDDVYKRVLSRIKKLSEVEFKEKMKEAKKTTLYKKLKKLR